CIFGIPDCVTGDSVSQPGEIVSEEQNTIHIQCQYTTSISQFVLDWYRHDAYRAPQFLIRKYWDDDERKADSLDPRFSMELNTRDKSTTLNIANARLSDAATYVCAI
ncbi:CLM5 protein, partial [Amia calva]|nr:CLM5 protein [Amia calva]